MVIIEITTIAEGFGSHPAGGAIKLDPRPIFRLAVLPSPALDAAEKVERQADRANQAIRVEEPFHFGASEASFNQGGAKPARLERRNLRATPFAPGQDEIGACPGFALHPPTQIYLSARHRKSAIFQGICRKFIEDEAERHGIVRGQIDFRPRNGQPGIFIHDIR